MAKHREAQHIELRWAEFNDTQDAFIRKCNLYEMSPTAEAKARVDGMKMALERSDVKDIEIVEVDTMVESLGKITRRDVVNTMTAARQGES